MSQPEVLSLAERLVADVLNPLKSAFVAKDEIVDLMGVCLVGGENLFLHGPPGTAKSAIVHELGRRLTGQVFDYLLTRFTEPNELFGPFDIRKLREGELLTNTEGMLPEATLVFLDELLNANSAILNSLLLVLNERVFRRGRETRSLPLVLVVGASNHLPEDEALSALFDRFLVRVPCRNVPGEQLNQVLAAGWQFEQRGERTTGGHFAIEDVRRLQQSIRSVDLTASRSAYVELILRLRQAGFTISDRRAVKFQRLVAASALLAGRMQAQPSDFWVLRYTWETEEQQQILAGLVQEAITRNAAQSPGPVHPRSQPVDHVNPEELARDLAALQAELQAPTEGLTDRDVLRDRLAQLASRCEWVVDSASRIALQQMLQNLWAELGKDSAERP